MSKKKAITLIGTDEAEKSIRKKWIIYGSIFIAVVFIFSVMAAGGSKPKRKQVEASFQDMTPEVTSVEQLTLAKMQKELREAQAAINEQKKLNERERENLEKRMEQEKTAFQSQIEKLEERSKKEREEADLKLEQAVKKAQDAEKSKVVTETNTALPSYIRPPRSSSASQSTTPPPPGAIREEGEGRTSLPSRQQNSEQGFSNLSSPIILKRGDNPGSVAVLEGAKRQSKDEKDDDNLSGFLPMGSFADVAILTGADFAAGSGSRSNPQPTLMRVQANAVLPGKAKYALADCFALGSGYGDLSSGRAYIQVSRMSCVNTLTGQMMETQLLGYLADSDGRLGMRGVIERRSGMILGKALLAGFAEGAAKILSDSARDMTSTITGGGVVNTYNTKKTGEAGAYAGAGRAAEILADQYIKEAEGIFPVIEIDAGRKATIVVQIGQKLHWMPVGEEQ